MGLATRLGPWLMGTVRNTTGTALGQIRNLGCDGPGQTKAVLFSDTATTNAFVIPAGSILTNLAFYSSVAFNGTAPTISVSLYNGTTTTPIGSAAMTSGTPYNNVIPFAATAAAGAAISNVGPTDVWLQYAISGTTVTTGQGVLLAEYLVRNPDGSYTPTAFTGP